MTTNALWQIQLVSQDSNGANVLLRRSDTGQWFRYVMNGRFFVAGKTGFRAIPNVGWSFQAEGDYDGDALIDVLIRHTNNRWYMVQGNGSAGFTGLTTNPAWHVVK